MKNYTKNCTHEFKEELLFDRMIQVCQKCRHYVKQDMRRGVEKLFEENEEGNIS